MAGQEFIRIGQVCTLLKGEFPDVSISKLRFLEEQKLVNPRRTPGGYRMYTHDNVEELRTILRMQRDEFLPLKVIREELRRRIEERRDGPSVRSGRVSFVAPPSFVSLDEMCRELECDSSIVEECEAWGLIEPVKKDGHAAYSSYDREVISNAVKLAGEGVAISDLVTAREASERLVAAVMRVANGSLKGANADVRAAAVRSVESQTESLVSLVRATLVRDVRQAVVRGIAAGVESSRSSTQST